MIQRIQSIWLLMASLMAFIGLKLPFYSGNKKLPATNETSGDLTGPLEYLTGSSNFVLLFLSIVVFILPLVTIFLYKDRKMQLKLCLASMFLEVLVLVAYFFEIRNFGLGTLSLTSILQGFILFFLFLAAKGIWSDEKIIRESERLR